MTMFIHELSSQNPQFEDSLAKLLNRQDTWGAEIDTAAAKIVKTVRMKGDEAVLHYTKKFDQVDAQKVSDLKLSKTELKKAWETISEDKRAALKKAAQNIRQFHEQQKLHNWEINPIEGMILGQRVTPLDRVGLYVPGGEAAYPSSVLMNAIPAEVAGVKSIVMMVPMPNGQINQLVLAAAFIAGVDEVYLVGGAQAIAALAYGTQTIKPVDKIVGPGNAYVASAKKQVFGTVGIDMIAGPSEVLIIADHAAQAEWITMDLFAQAEHDPLAQSILISPVASLLETVKDTIQRLLPTMSRQKIIAQSLKNHGALIKVNDLAEAAEITNQIAPEHLEIMTRNPKEVISKIKHAGAIFLGDYASESLGDYCAGPNHVLPTSRTARFSSPLGVYDFQKRSNTLQINRKAANELGDVAYCLAQGEGLTAHALAAKMRTGSNAIE